MLSSEVQNQLMRLRGTGEPLLDYVADVLQDALAAQNAEFAGQLTLRSDPDKMNPGTQPPEHPKLPNDQPTVLLIDHPTGFQKPGDTGPNGGVALTVRGPTQFVPNRDLDVTIDTPHGTIRAGGLTLDGEPITPPQSGDGCGSTGTFVFGMVDGVPTCFEVDTSSCP